MRRILLTLSTLLCLVPAFAQKRFAVVDFSASYLRAAPDYESALETQALMGSVVEVLGRERYWVKVRAMEPDYVAWTNEQGLVEMSNEELDAYIAKPKLICTAETSHIFEQPSEKAQRICDLVMGDLVIDCKSKTRTWCCVMLPSGRKGYVRRQDVEPFDIWAASVRPSGESICALARRLIGVPYLWGGCTPKGTDCSGLVRLCYQMHGVLLPRNASQQIKCGQAIDISGVADGDFCALREGDLVFFGNRQTGVPSHVALYLGGGRIIHSSQVIKVNSLVPGQADYYAGAARLIGACRILTGKAENGVTMIGDCPWYFAQ